MQWLFTVNICQTLIFSGSHLFSIYYLFCRYINDPDEVNIQSTTGMFYLFWAADNAFALHNMYIS